MYIDIQGLPIKISPETIEAFLAHREFCSPGTDWLGKMTPNANWKLN